VKKHKKESIANALIQNLNFPTASLNIAAALLLEVYSYTSLIVICAQYVTLTMALPSKSEQHNY
jgi:hypothetical protein